MIICSTINDAAEKLLGRSPSINTAKVKRKPYTKKINRFVYICAKKCIGSLLFIITVTLFFSPHWPYILFIERRVPVVYYNPSKFSMDNAWTSKPTCAYMTMEILTSNKHRTSQWKNQSGDSNWPRHTEHVQTSNQIMFNTHTSRVQWVD